LLGIFIYTKVSEKQFFQFQHTFSTSLILKSGKSSFYSKKKKKRGKSLN
jgi:hypothetical protein